MDGAGYFQRLSQLLLPWHWDTAPHPPPRESVHFPGATGTPGGGVIWGQWFACPPQSFTGMGRRGGWGAKALSALPSRIPSRCAAAGAGVHNPTGSWYPARDQGNGGAPRGLQADPTPAPPLTYPGMEILFFPPIVPRFGANPQHRPSCDSGMGGCSSCVPGVTLHQHPLPEPPQLCLSLSLSPLAQPRRCCR